MNKGIDLSKGDWLYFLGADDILFQKNTLTAVLKKLCNDNANLIIGKTKYDYCNEDSMFLKKNDGEVQSSLSKKIWFKNTIHHQGIFYKSKLFKHQYYCLKYSVLADYALNLNFFVKGVEVIMIKDIIAICGTNGLSKVYSWKIYKEEIALKTNQSSVLLKPVFFTISFIKYLIKKKI